MAVFSYKGVGLRNVGSYQISGEPYITGSGDQATNTMKRYKFPSVTREVTVFNLPTLADGATASTEIKVHFVSGSAALSFTDATDNDDTGMGTVGKWANGEVVKGHHFVPLLAGQSVSFTTKVKEIYITTVEGVARYRVMADLTGIPATQMYHLTGSGHTTTP
jgi:hypothetical protein